MSLLMPGVFIADFEHILVQNSWRRQKAEFSWRFQEGIEMEQ